MKIGLSFLGDLLIFIGKIIITLGGFFQSNDHFEVLSQIDGPITNKILDIALIISYFVVGFVMIAGAGSNLNQQFDLSIIITVATCILYANVKLVSTRF